MKSVILPTLDDPTSPGGVARYIRAIEQTFPEAVEVIDFGRPIPSRREILKRFEEIGNKQQIWIHHIFPLGTCAFFCHLKTQTSYTIFLHGMDFDLARRTLWRRCLAKIIFRFAKNIVVNSEALGKEVKEFCGVQSLVVYPCVADELVEASRTNTSPPAGLPTGQAGRIGGVVFLSVSRLVERKGHLKVLEALKYIPDAKYIIVGDGPMRDVILDQIDELGISDRVELKTDIKNEELPGLYQSADIFVMPTSKTTMDREGFGIVYLEAALFELPVIAVNQPGVDEAVIHEKTGILIQDRSEDLLFAMQRLVKDAKLRESLGQTGRRRVLAAFTREKQMEKLREIL
jgi:phosphatidyl-myo-inositol dimannoside synthase